MTGEQFRQARHALGLTQAEVAKRAGVSVATVIRLEAGKGGNYQSVVAVAGVVGLAPMQTSQPVDDPLSPANLRQLADKLEQAHTEPTYRVLAESVQVPIARSVAGAGSGSVYADAEYVPYSPPAQLRGHQFVAVLVNGSCLSPRISDGDVVVIDRDTTPIDGDIVAVRHDHEELLRLWSGGQLLSYNSHPPIIPDARTEIVGVVVASQRRFR